MSIISKEYTEVFCPIIGKNVIIGSNNSQSNCFNIQSCCDKYGGCKNKRIGK